MASSIDANLGRAAAVTLLPSTVINAAATTNNPAVSGLGGMKRALILLNLTAVATVAGDTLDVYVDVSPDGGTTYVNAIHFTQLLGNGGAKKLWAIIDPVNPGTSVIDATSDAAAGAVRPGIIADLMRVRTVMVNGGGSGSFTLSVKAFLQA